MNVDGTNEIKAYQMRKFSEDIGVNYKLVAQTIDKVSQAITKVFIDDLKEIVVQRAEAFKDISINMSEVTY